MDGNARTYKLEMEFENFSFKNLLDFAKPYTEYRRETFRFSAKEK